VVAQCGIDLSLARRGARTHGVDLTPGHVELTRERLRLNGFAPRLVNADAEALPFPDNRFDFVYSFGVVHHSPDTARAVSEIFRVLKPGGRIAVSDILKRAEFSREILSHEHAYSG